MNSDAFQRAAEIFLIAHDVPPEQRDVLLTKECGGDAELRAEVERLLAAQEKPLPFETLANQLEGVRQQFDQTTVISQPALGEFIGRYKLLQVIGEGGFGTVYMAEQKEPVQRRVALKLIKLGMDTRQVIARFEAERQALAIMDHPHVAKVFDAGATDSGRPYFVMELVEGVPITEYCDKNKLSIEQRLRMFAQVCQAVQHAHQKGLIHRDIKPSNILVTTRDDQPFAKVIDFGVAKATQAKLTEKTFFTEFRQLVGTPEYMSPEQAYGNMDVDTRSDIYSLGVLLYELLTGVTPFDGRELRSKAYGEMQRIIREVDPPTPSARLSTLDKLPSVAAQRSIEPAKLSATVRGELDWIVMKCLEKDRARRYETANGLASDVARYLANEPLLAGPVSRGYRFRKFARRNRIGFAFALATIALIIAATAIYITGVRREQRKTHSALVEAERQRTDAQRAQATAQAINDFLKDDMIAAADPRQTQGRDVSVKEALDKASAGVHEKFADQPIVEAAVRNTLALTYHELGRNDEAVMHARVALDLRRKLLGNEHEDTLVSINHMGMFLRATGHIDEAESLWREAVETGTRVNGPDDSKTVLWTFNLAHIVEDRGDLAEAETLYRRVLENWRRTIPDNHERIAAAMNRLAGLLMTTRRFAEAEPLFLEALEKRRATLGEKHPDTIYSVNDLAYLRRVQGRLDESQALARQTLALEREVLGSEHPSTLVGMNNLAVELVMSKRPAEAEPLAREALEISRRISSADHPRSISIQYTLAGALEDQGKHEEAEAMYRDLIERMRRAFGPQHMRTRAAIERFADLLIAQERLIEAEPLLAEIAQEADLPLPPEQRFGPSDKYGLLLVKLKRFADAYHPLRHAYDQLRPDDHANLARRREILSALIEVCRATNRTHEVATLQQQLATMPATTMPATTRSAP